MVTTKKRSGKAGVSTTTKVGPPVKTFGRLTPLPPGAISPEGWLRDYARINAEGWLLHYARNQDVGVYGKLWQRNETAAVIFDEQNQTLTLCDYTAYFADGLMHYAQLFPDSELAREAQPWLELLLASQDTDGYIGAFAPGARWQHWLEIFSQSLTLEALLYRYECTGETDLLRACKRAAKPQMKAWHQPDKGVNPGIFSGHGTIITRLMGRLYALTGKARYLDMAREVMARYGRVQDFLKPGDALFDQHNVIGTEHVGLPAMLYEYTGDPALLEASQAAWEMMQKHLSIDGTPHGNEAMRQSGPRQNCEHCSTVEWFITSNALARMTGEVKYADAAERAMLNAYPAAKTPDGMAVAYMHTPNQLVASEWSNPHFDSLDWWASRQHYSTAHEPLCCNSNGPRGLPYYIGAMVMRAGKGLAVVYYGPCQVRTALPDIGSVTLCMDTGYPFEDQVTLTVNPERTATFPLRLRIPEWCSSATLAVNGQEVDTEVIPGTFPILRRRWHPGDQVLLRFEMPIRLIEHPRSEFGVRVGGLAIQRGPLTFALPVKEEWQPFEAPAHGPGQGIKSCRVFAARDAAWNYALLIDREHPESSLSLTRLPVSQDGRPWEHPPLGLQVRARRVLSWRMDGDPEHPMTPGLPYHPMRLADEEELITLVPFGSTHLRLTYLPVAGS